MKKFKVGILMNSVPRPTPFAVYTYRAADKADAKRQAEETIRDLERRHPINRFYLSKVGPREATV